MLIKFTNGSDQFKGNDLYINSDHIVAVYEFTKPEDNTNTIMTIIYGGPQGSEWYVNESLAEVNKRLKAALKGEPIKEVKTKKTVKETA